MKNYFFGAVGVLLLLSQSVLADSYSVPKRTHLRPAAQEDSDSEAPWYIFIGGDAGISNYSAYNNSSTETARSGFQGGARLLLAHYWDSWVIDGGLGWQYINNSGTNSDGTQNTDNSKNIYLDLSPRYRLTQNIQLGPEVEYWLSTDQGLNPTIPGTDTISNASNTSFWIGAQALYEWTGDQKIRLGARGLYGISVSGRTVDVFQGFIQIGFDVFNSSPDTSRSRYEQVNEADLHRAEELAPREALPMATPEPSPEPLNPNPVVMSTPAMPETDNNPESATDSAITAPLSATEDLVPSKKSKAFVLTLDVNDLPFGFNNATLPKSNAARVKNMGTYLAAHNGSWKKLVVAGHTDERGKKDYNLRLSKYRAEAVKDLLVSGGAKESKIKVVGYGASKPKDPHHTEKAWTRNRRVELEFQGVTDKKVIKKAMNQ